MPSEAAFEKYFSQKNMFKAVNVQYILRVHIVHTYGVLIHE